MSEFPRLAALLQTIEPEIFFEDHWRKTPFHLTDRAEDIFSDVLSIDELDHIISHGPEKISTVNNRETMSSRVSHPDADIDEVLNRFRTGATVVFDALQGRAPGLKNLCRDLQRETNISYQTNIYVTPPNGQGFGVHVDNHCVFILQIHGTKTWRVGTCVLELGPNGKVDLEEAAFLENSQPETIQMKAGDLLYIPENVAHDAQTSDQGSVHVTLGLHPSAWAGYIRSLLTQIVENAPELEGHISPGFLEGGRDQFSAQLAEKISKLLSNEVLESAITADIEQRRSAIAESAQGRFTQILLREDLDQSDTFSCFGGTVILNDVDDGQVEILFSGKSIVLPSFTRPSVEFCIRTNDFKISDMPDDLDHDAKQVLLKRFLQEGLVQKK